MGLGFGFSGGAAGVQDAIKEILMRRALAKQQGFENDLALRRQSASEQQLAESAAERRAAAAETERAHRETAEAKQTTNTLRGVALRPVGGFVAPEEYAKETALGVPQALYNKQDATLPSTQMSGIAAPTEGAPQTIQGSLRMIQNEAKPEGYTFSASQANADKAAELERKKAADAATQDYRTGQLEVRQGMNDIRAQLGSQRYNQMTPSQTLSAVRNLQNDWRKAIKPVREINTHVQKMQQGLAAAKQGDLNAGSQVIINEFNKILDPASVVRESEYARTPAGLGVLQRIQGLGERIAQGGPGVPVEQLETFVTLAKQMADGMQHYADADKRRITSVASRYQLAPADIFDEGDLSPTSATTEVPAGGNKPTAADLIKKYGGPR